MIDSNLAAEASHLGEHVIERWLTARTTCLCVDENGRHVVLKRLEDDCLFRGRLHPSIKERLARVRELPLKNLATLRTVERADGAAFLVWEFVEGQTLTEWTSAPNVSFEEWTAVVRRAVLSVEAMHALGIVHGAVHGRNILVNSRGEVWLTHVSPLLYTDPADDVFGVIEFLREAIVNRKWENTTLGKWLAEADAKSVSLAAIVRRFETGLPDVGDAKSENTARADHHIRWRAIAAALAAAVIGISVTLFVRKMTMPRETAPVGFERLDAVPTAR